MSFSADRPHSDPAAARCPGRWASCRKGNLSRRRRSASRRSAEAASPPRSAEPDRLAFLDGVRGLALVVMVLDHVGVLFGDPLERRVPTSIAQFLTHWAAGFCGPAFFLLAGAGAGLRRSAGRTAAETSFYLAGRGVLLILLDLVVASPLWQWCDFSWRVMACGVLWALGVSMVLLAGLLWLPRLAVLVFGLTLIAAHNALDALTPSQCGGWGWLWQIGHVPGRISLGGNRALDVVFPIIPWVGVMALGYAGSGLFRLESSRRRRRLIGLAGGLLLGFILLRSANGYGEPRPRQDQADPTAAILDFINCTSYPPSLQGLLLTLGAALLLLAAFDQWPAGPVKVLGVFGRVPLFFYLAHLLILAGAAAVIGRLGVGKGRFASFEAMVQTIGLGVPLEAQYLLGLLVVVVLYRPCTGYAAVKRRHSGSWLDYL